jgi:hypothetical protein
VDEQQRKRKKVHLYFISLISILVDKSDAASFLSFLFPAVEVQFLIDFTSIVWLNEATE